MSICRNSIKTMVDEAQIIWMWPLHDMKLIIFVYFLLLNEKFTLHVLQ